MSKSLSEVIEMTTAFGEKITSHITVNGNMYIPTMLGSVLLQQDDIAPSDDHPYGGSRFLFKCVEGPYKRMISVGTIHAKRFLLDKQTRMFFLDRVSDGVWQGIIYYER